MCGRGIIVPVNGPPTDSTRRSYDKIANAYTARFGRELDDKPFDREFLDAVADSVPRPGWCVDLGSGPSHIGAYLARWGLAILSVDTSHEMLRHASVLVHGGVQVQADMRALPFADRSIAGIIAFYSLIHISRTELMTTLVELGRVLAKDGVVAVAAHAAPPGNRTDQPMSALHVEEMLSEPVDLDFHFYPAEVLGGALRSLDFNLVRATERDPYDTQVEAQTRRAYVLARNRP